jgi:glycosyltransferase involved in cell wall biosynthesis
MRSKLGPGDVRIAYCGPIAQPSQPARGGYESANRRLIDDLRLRRVDVIEFAYPVALGTTLRKSVTYTRRFAAIALEMVQQRQRYKIFHLTPLYRQFIWAEAVLCMLAWSLGKRVAFDIRAGSFIHDYENRSTAYRILVDALMRRADVVAVEGEEFIPFAEARNPRPILNLPNYYNPRPADPETNSRRDDERIRIVFLGRVVPEKGIETAIGAVQALQDMGVPAHLDVIGRIEDSYLLTLGQRAANLPVTFHGPLAPDIFRAKLAESHFFIFPTVHNGEGHSNALTEAMAEGLVPICSDNGFNRSVVGDAGRVLPLDATASDYAKIIADIGKGSDWRELSHAASRRIAEHFTGVVVLPVLIETYRAALV